MKKFIAVLFMAIFPGLANATSAEASLTNFTFNFTASQPIIDLDSFTATTYAFANLVDENVDILGLPANYSFEITANAVESNASAYAHVGYSPTNPLTGFESIVSTNSGTAFSSSSAYIFIDYIGGSDLTISADAHILGTVTGLNDYASGYANLLLQNANGSGHGNEQRSYILFGNSESYDFQQTLYLSYFSKENQRLYLSATLYTDAIAEPVPEPEKYAMILTGLCLMAFCNRLRKSKNQT